MAISQSQKKYNQGRMGLNGKYKHLASDDGGGICSTFVNQERDDDPRRDVFVYVCFRLVETTGQPIYNT